MLNHHANLILGQPALLLETLLNSLEQDHGISRKNNPDLHVIETDVLTIGEAREIQRRQVLSAFAGRERVKIFIISVNSITVEAQNALLKTLEEPSLNTHFFLILRRDDKLLPTLKSRLEFIKLANESEPKINTEEAEKFLCVSPAERLKIIKTIVDTKDKETATRFISSVESFYRASKSPEQWDYQDILAFDRLNKARDYLFDRGSSVKILLEHIALTMPLLKNS